MLSLAASYGVSETSSAIRSPRLVSSSLPIGVSSEIVRWAAWMICWIFFGSDGHRLGNLFRGWLAAELLGKHVQGLPVAGDRVTHMHWKANGAALVRDGAGNRLANPPGGIGAESETLAPVVLLHGAHQADVAFLDQVEQTSSRGSHSAWQSRRPGGGWRARRAGSLPCRRLRRAWRARFPVRGSAGESRRSPEGRAAQGH